jgi:O-antigen/teichoic acid export membrane protein|tara:strand:- start:8133 stop:9368 length:1236 start_codon:yes stop_codon:yes gene_type:complete
MTPKTQERSEDRHALLSRLLLLLFTTAIIVLNSRTLGASGQGEIAWIQLGILMVTGLSGFLAGGTVVFLQKEMHVGNVLLPGHIWLVISAIVSTGIGTVLQFLPASHFVFIAATGWLQGAIIFHGQVLLAERKIKSHNALQVLQAGALLVILCTVFANTSEPKVTDFLRALAASLAIAFVASIILVLRQVALPSKEERIATKQVARRLWTYGRSAQTGALLQMLTNRANLSLLAQAPAGVAASGIYSIAFYGLEAMWLIPRALAPLVYTRTASENSKDVRLTHTKRQLGKAVLGTAVSLVGALLIPENIYSWVFGFEGIRPVVVGLAPAAIAGAISSIVAHHLSGIGQHRWNAWTSGAGLVTLLVTAAAWIPDGGAVGAAHAASAAAVVQAIGLLVAWSKCELTPVRKLLF